MTKRDAKRMGRERGKAAASWVFDGNTTDATYRVFLERWMNGDPALDEVVTEPAWLSGEWAGESISELLPDLPEDEDRADEYMAIYEEAASNAFWREVERTARRMVS